MDYRQGNYGIAHIAEGARREHASWVEEGRTKLSDMSGEQQRERGEEAEQRES